MTHPLTSDDINISHQIIDWEQIEKTTLVH